MIDDRTPLEQPSGRPNVHVDAQIQLAMVKVCQVVLNLETTGPTQHFGVVPIVGLPFSSAEFCTLVEILGMVVEDPGIRRKAVDALRQHCTDNPDLASTIEGVLHQQEALPMIEKEDSAIEDHHPPTPTLIPASLDQVRHYSCEVVAI